MSTWCLAFRTSLAEFKTSSTGSLTSGSETLISFLEISSTASLASCSGSEFLLFGPSITFDKISLRTALLRLTSSIGWFLTSGTSPETVTSGPWQLFTIKSFVGAMLSRKKNV